MDKLSLNTIKLNSILENVKDSNSVFNKKLSGSIISLDTEEYTTLKPQLTFSPSQSNSKTVDSALSTIPSLENIKQINSVEKIKIVCQGRNLLDTYIYPYQGVGGTNGYDEFTIDPPFPPGTYTVSASVSSTKGAGVSCLFGMANKSMGENVFTYATFKASGAVEKHQIVMTDYCNKIRITSAGSVSESKGQESFWDNLQLEFSDCAHDYSYAPNSVQTFEIDLGKKIYSGILDLENKQLIEDMALLTLTGNENFSVSSVTSCDRFLLKISDAMPLSELLCSHAFNVKMVSPHNSSIIGGADINENSAFGWNFSAKDTTLEKFKQYLKDQASAGTPVQILYKLNTPRITILESVPEIFTDSNTKVIYSNANSIELNVENNNIIVPPKTNWERQLLQRIEQLLIPKRALRNMPKAPNGYIHCGEIMTGVNYSSVYKNFKLSYTENETNTTVIVDTPGITGTQVSLSTYYSAVDNPYSEMYTNNYYRDDEDYKTLYLKAKGTSDDKSRSSYYGINCSGFVSYVCGFSEYHWTGSLSDTNPKSMAHKWKDQVLEIWELDDLDIIRRGDVLLNTMVTSGGEDHVRIVKDVIINCKTRKVIGFNIAESWKPYCKITFYTPEDFLAQMYESQPYRVVRLRDEEWGDTIQEIKYSKTIYPSRGDGGSYKLGETVELYISDPNIKTITYAIENSAPITINLSDLNLSPINKVTYILPLTTKGKYTINTTTINDPCIVEII